MNPSDSQQLNGQVDAMTGGQRFKVIAVLTFMVVVFSMILAAGLLALDPHQFSTELLGMPLKSLFGCVGMAILLPTYLVVIVRVALGKPSFIGQRILRQLGSKQSFRMHLSEVTLGEDDKAAMGDHLPL
jgi:hypothetical protein